MLSLRHDAELRRCGGWLLLAGSAMRPPSTPMPAAGRSGASIRSAFLTPPLASSRRRLADSAMDWERNLLFAARCAVARCCERDTDRHEMSCQGRFPEPRKLPEGIDGMSRALDGVCRNSEEKGRWQALQCCCMGGPGQAGNPAGDGRQSASAGRVRENRTVAFRLTHRVSKDRGSCGQGASKPPRRRG